MPSVLGSTETAVLDSSEFISGRVALELDKLGIHIREANWGDAEMELFMIKQELGEIPAERHPPNRVVTLKLLVTREAGITFAEALNKLQAKVNTLQESGGWIKRIMDYRGQFKRKVGAIVYKASLTGIDGWYMGHRGGAPEITLTMNCSPYFYATEEVELNAVTVSNGHEIEWEIPEPIGTAPGLLRLEIENKNTGTAGDWHGAISAIESRDHSSAVTANLGYLASELTRLGVATEGTRTGSVGAKTVKSKLQVEWQQVLGSKITASGQMTHVGPRNLLARVWWPNLKGTLVTLKLQWKALGSDYWTTNEETSPQVPSGFSFINLGECRPELATLGNQQWEWRILAKSGIIEEEIEIDKLWILPTEQYLQLVFERESETFNLLKLEDYFRHEEAESTEPGGNRKAQQTGGTYESLGRAQTGGNGFTYRKVTNTFNTSPWPEGLFARQVLEDTEPTFLVCPTKLKSLDFSGWIGNLGDLSGEALGNYAAPGVRNGIVFRVVDKLNYGFFHVEQTVTPVVGAQQRYKKLQIGKVVAGVKTILAEMSVVAHGGSLSQAFFNVTVDTAGKVTAWLSGVHLISTYNGSSYTDVNSTTSLLSATDEVFAATKTLAEGKCGIYQYAPKVAEYTVFKVRWGELRAEEIQVEERGAVCYSGKKLELRSDGCFREAVAETTWARLTPVGFMPYLKPGGLEVKPMKGIIIPTRGDFESLADSESNSMSVKARYRPAYLFTSGAS